MPSRSLPGNVKFRFLVYHFDQYNMNRKERSQQAKAAKKSRKTVNHHASAGGRLANQGRIDEATR
jgi:hypothetical protein